MDTKMKGPRKMKYHYEYEVRIYKLDEGTMSLGRCKTYLDAITEVMNEKLSLFNIKKVRVYE